ncbi:MAG: glycosyltransferase family 4 protein [Actinobacteria bacterium]|nr:glycosyltransferase family 4 protein [Actinomycetota bacterium]
MAYRAAELAVGSGLQVRIAIVSPYGLDRPGGVQEQARGLTKHLTSAGHDVRLIGPGTSDGSWISTGGTTEVEANAAIAPVCLEPGAVAKVKESIVWAQVVHVHEPLVPVVGPAAWMGEGIPSVGTFHADPAAIVRGIYRFGGPLLAHLLGRIDALTAVSEEAARAIRSFVPHPLLIPNGVDVATFEVSDDRVPHRVAFVGRDDRRKGLDVLLQAWPRVLGTVPDAELVVVGARRDLQIPGVSFEGRVSEERKRSLLGSAAVYCGPNTGGESFGITLVEGMAASCAIVASDLPAFRSVAGPVAFYVRPGDAEDLATTLVDVLTDRARMRAMGEAARRRALRFDWSRVIPRWVRLYTEVSEGFARRHRR